MRSSPSPSRASLPTCRVRDDDPFEYAGLEGLLERALRDVSERRLTDRERAGAARLVAFLLTEQLVTETVTTDVLTALWKAIDLPLVVRTLLRGLRHTLGVREGRAAREGLHARGEGSVRGKGQPDHRRRARMSRELLVTLALPEYLNPLTGTIVVRGDRVERAGVPISWAEIVKRAAELAGVVAITVDGDTGEIRIVGRTGQVEVVEADELADVLRR